MGRFSNLEVNASNERRGGRPPAGDLRVGEAMPEPILDAEGRLDLGAKACIERGDHALYRSDLKGALRWYSRAIDEDSTHLESWVNLLQVLLLRGNLSEAISWMQRGLALHPDAAALLGLRAVIHARRGMMRQALNTSDVVLERAGDQPLSHLVRGQVLMLAGNRNADYCFEQALKLTGRGDFKTPYQIALFLMDQRQWAKAIDYFRTAEERNPRHPALWYQVGVCRANLGHRAQAQRAFAQAREMCAPEDPLLKALDRAWPGSLWRRLANIFRA